MVRDTRVPNYKVAYGTKNMVKEPAMTREEALQAILTGVHLVKEKKKQDIRYLRPERWESVIQRPAVQWRVSFLDESVETMTGEEPDLTVLVLEERYMLSKQPLQKISQMQMMCRCTFKVGGFDLAGLVGIYLGGAYHHVPVIMDGFISAVAALAAVQMCNNVREYIIVSHVSKEPGMHILLKALGREASMTCDMCLGEGTGAVAFLPVLDMALAVYEKMSTFSDIHIDDYEELGDK